MGCLIIAYLMKVETEDVKLPQNGWVDINVIIII